MHRSGEFFGRRRAERRLGAFSLSVTDYAPGSATGWHEHSAAYLTYIERGGYRERLRHSAHDCSRDQIVRHEAGERHADEFSAATRCINIQIDPEWLRRWEVSLDNRGPVASSDISSTMLRLRREIQSNDAMSSMAAEGLLFELVAAVTRDHSPAGAPSWLRHVHEEVMTRFREPLTLSALASTAAVHPVHLAKSFRKHFQTTVGDLLRKRRIEFAAARIAAGAALADVALDAGFADQSHFSRAFRRLTGETPSQFRRARIVPER